MIIRREKDRSFQEMEKLAWAKVIGSRHFAWKLEYRKVIALPAFYYNEILYNCLSEEGVVHELWTWRPKPFLACPEHKTIANGIRELALMPRCWKIERQEWHGLRGYLTGIGDSLSWWSGSVYFLRLLLLAKGGSWSKYPGILSSEAPKCFHQRKHDIRGYMRLKEMLGSFAWAE